MTQIIKVIFFGSTSDSVIVLEKLFLVPGVTCQAVVTQPPRPVGRGGIITPTPVEIWAKQHAVAVLSFPQHAEKNWLYENEQTVIDTLNPLGADLIVSASYGVKIPQTTITDAKFGGLNIHPSILPRWRGADPVPWAILSGDHQTGVTIVTLTEKFDEGKIIGQKKIPITDSDLADPLRTKLFTIGSELLTEILPKYLASPNHFSLPRGTSGTYARKFTRDDGFEPWELLVRPEEAGRIHRKFRALHPWPGVWTEIHVSMRQSVNASKKKLRLKILGFDHAPTVVQLEGKKPVSFGQFSEAYLKTS